MALDTGEWKFGLQRGRAPESAEISLSDLPDLPCVILQRGRAPESTEMIIAYANSSVPASLQRGRAPESAEISES